MMNKNNIVKVFLIISGLTVFLACHDKSLYIPIAGLVEGNLVEVSGCIHLDIAMKEQEDIIQYQYKKGVLNIQHIGTAFNCCPDSIGGPVFIEGDTIEIIQYENLNSGGCRCMCLYNLSYMLNNVLPKTWRIKVNAIYLPNDEETHDFTIDLATDQEGTHSITRDIYPWCN